MSQISVIIPSYNRRHLLGYTINSILNQTLPPYEVIVVDDNSTDGTIGWLEEQYKSKLKIIKNVGKGPGAARNTGLNIAKGKYIQFFDSDDLLSNNKFEVQLQLLQNKTDTFVYGPYAIATAPPDDWNLTDAILQYYPFPGDNLLKWIYRGWCSITQACLFPRELIEKVGPWREDIHTHEDREYWYRVAKTVSSAPLHENKSCTVYRQHENQLTLKTERQLQRSLDAIIVDQEILNNNDIIDFVSKLLLKARINATKDFINNLTSENKYKTSVIYKATHRINSKINRLRTSSNWEKMHGTTTDYRIFMDYIKNVQM